MQYALLIYGDEKVWDTWTDEDFAANGEVHARFVAKATVLAGVQLAASREATTVRDHVSISDGPYAEAAETLGGLYLIDAADLDEALALAKMLPEGVVEVRPVVPHP